MSSVSVPLARSGTLESAGAPDRRPTVARVVVVVVLLVLMLGEAYSIFIRAGLAQWIGALQRGSPANIAGTVVLLGGLALVVPTLRGGRWPLGLTLPLLVLLLPVTLPFLPYAFVRPATFVNWMLVTTISISSCVGIGFGLVALLESFGKLRSVGIRAIGGGLTRPAAIALSIAAAWVGMVTVAAAVARIPAASATFAGTPSAAMLLSMENTRFATPNLDLPAGQATVLVLTNRDSGSHSFDIDALDVHVFVPAGSTALTVLNPPTAGALTFHCAIEGHTEAGMVGSLNVQ
jgi:uncharacterized cupredoxin-like copper-binding protein